jgi:3-dehydroquinate synthase
MKKFTVPLKKSVDDTYDIAIGKNLQDELLSDIQNGLLKGVSKLALVTDSNVSRLYAESMLASLVEAGLQAQLFTFPAGEGSKSRKTKALLEDQLIKNRFGRDSAVIAIGGGVVSDLAGYLAGTFARGIPFINYATTLLAAADASVGGKTAVNTPIATNLIGLFHQPVKVYIDFATWQTLSAREIRCGLAETIKHACLADSDFFSWLEQNITKVLALDGSLVLDDTVCEHIAHKNCEIKYSVVERDERESNLRQVLNLGHTVGRALEALMKYKMLHGEAVSVGLMAQAHLALRFGYIDDNDYQRIESLLENAGLPVRIPSPVNIQKLLDRLYTDKKVRKGKIRFVFQKGIGAMMQFEGGNYSREVTEAEILPTLQALKA